jgi:hypothetical protein
MRWDEGEVRDHAARNHALIDRGTAVGLGATDATIKTRLQNGAWTGVHPGVYYLNVTSHGWKAQVRGAVMAAGPHALASHRTAGVLWGLDGIRGRMIEITVPFSKTPTPTGVIVHRTRRPLPGAVVDGIPVTTVGRTLLDMATTLPQIVLEKALMSALHLKVTTPDLLAQCLAEYGGRGVRGTKKLRRTLSQVDHGITGSPSEVEVMRLMRYAPIPVPRCQFEIRFPDGTNAYPDFTWPDRAKCIEVDGFDAHGSPEALERDLERQNKLLELGWEMRRFSARQVRRDPGGVLNEIVRFVNG